MIELIKVTETDYYFKDRNKLVTIESEAQDNLLKYPRVTSVVSKFKDNAGLDKWRENTPDHEAITKSASDLGKQIHAIMAGESYYVPEGYEDSDLTSRAAACTKACTGLNYINIETTLRNDNLRYAGTTDAIVQADPALSWRLWNGEARLGNRIGILDYKFKKQQPWNPAYLFQYCLQLGFYSLAAKELNLAEPNFGVICCTWLKQTKAETKPVSGLWVIDYKALMFFENKAIELIEAYHNDGFVSWNMLLYEAGYLGMNGNKPAYTHPNLMPNRVKEVNYNGETIDLTI